jgi:hypothetical protein
VSDSSALWCVCTINAYAHTRRLQSTTNALLYLIHLMCCCCCCWWWCKVAQQTPVFPEALGSRRYRPPHLMHFCSVRIDFECRPTLYHTITMQCNAIQHNRTACVSRTQQTSLCVRQACSQYIHLATQDVGALVLVLVVDLVIVATSYFGYAWEGSLGSCSPGLECR